MLDKTIERTIKIPRVRISDCCRLIFRLGRQPTWRDMDLDPDLYPIYPLPPLSRKVYTLEGNRINISPGDNINDLVRKICKVIEKSNNCYLHTIIFKVSGTLEIQTEII